MEKERGKLLNTRDALWDHVFFLLDGKFAMLSRPRAGFFDDADKRPLSLTSCFLSPFQKKQQQNSRHPRRRLVQVRTKNVFGLNFFSLFSRSPSFSLFLSLPLLSLTREEKKLNLVNFFRGWGCGAGRGVAGAAVGTAVGVGVGYAVANNQNNNCYNSECGREPEGEREFFFFSKRARTSTAGVLTKKTFADSSLSLMF